MSEYKYTEYGGCLKCGFIGSAEDHKCKKKVCQPDSWPIDEGIDLKWPWLARLVAKILNLFYGNGWTDGIPKIERPPAKLNYFLRRGGKEKKEIACVLYSDSLKLTNVSR